MRNRWVVVLCVAIVLAMLVALVVLALGAPEEGKPTKGLTDSEKLPAKGPLDSQKLPLKGDLNDLPKHPQRQPETPKPGRYWIPIGNA